MFSTEEQLNKEYIMEENNKLLETICRLTGTEEKVEIAGKTIKEIEKTDEEEAFFRG